LEVARVLSSYTNGELLNNGGPTVDLIEVAVEWQGKGIGSLILAAVEIYFQKLFKDCYKGRKHGTSGLWLSATKVIDYSTIEWLEKREYMEVYQPGG
jgi:GNAT superfamily N-acetyltransferase